MVSSLPVIWLKKKLLQLFCLCIEHHSRLWLSVTNIATDLFIRDSYTFNMYILDCYILWSCFMTMFTVKIKCNLSIRLGMNNIGLVFLTWMTLIIKPLMILRLTPKTSGVCLVIMFHVRAVVMKWTFLWTPQTMTLSVSYVKGFYAAPCEWHVTMSFARSASCNGWGGRKTTNYIYIKDGYCKK